MWGGFTRFLELVVYGHLENVAQRHGAVTKAMHEQRFQNPLDVMEGVTQTRYTGKRTQKAFCEECCFQKPRSWQVGLGKGIFWPWNIYIHQQWSLKGTAEPFPGWVYVKYSLYDPVFAGGEVVLGGVDEGQSEIEHQIDEERSDALGQEHLTEKRKWERGWAVCFGVLLMEAVFSKRS